MVANHLEDSLMVVDLRKLEPGLPLAGHKDYLHLDHNNCTKHKLFTTLSSLNNLPFKALKLVGSKRKDHKLMVLEFQQRDMDFDFPSCRPSFPLLFVHKCLLLLSFVVRIRLQ